MFKLDSIENKGQHWEVNFTFKLIRNEPIPIKRTFSSEFVAQEYLARVRRDVLFSNLEHYVNKNMAQTDEGKMHSVERAMKCLDYMIENKCDVSVCASLTLKMEKHLFNILDQKDKNGLNQLNDIIKFCKHETKGLRLGGTGNP